MSRSQRKCIASAFGCLATSLLALIAISCSGKPADPPGAVKLHGAGATFPAVLYDEWFTKYGDNHPQVLRINYEAVGSGEGVKRFLNEEVDFAASDNGLSEAEAKKVSRGVLQVPVTAGAIALIYNLPGIEDLKLTRQAYAGIFLGTVTRWNDPAIANVNPGLALPSREIISVVRLDGSGTTFLFTNHLAAASEEWRKQHGPTGKRKLKWTRKALEEDGNEAVGGKVKVTEGAIGYVDLGTARKANLKAARLVNRAGTAIPAKPLNATLALHGVKDPTGKPAFVPDPEGQDDYPIAGFTYLMLYRKYDDPDRLAALKGLVEWCVTDGQNESERLGYVRLSPSAAAKVIRAVRELEN